MFGRRKVSKSLRLWEEGKKLIPGGSQTMSKSPGQYVFGVHPIYLESGHGCMVRDIDGNQYIDFPGALGAIVLGYNYPRVTRAVTKQVKRGSTFSLMHPAEVELAELLTEVVPCAEMVRYGKNGSDVLLAAVRVARAITGQEKILKPIGHYHGWHDWHVASTERNAGVPKVMGELIEQVPYNNLELLEQKLATNEFAAFVLEPVSLEEPLPGYLQGVRDLCTKYGALLIFDEMVTGFRWALGGAQEYYKVTPDLATFGKAMANGMPISALVGLEQYMQELNKIFFSSTFGGEVCSIVAAIETIKEMKERRFEIFPHIWEQGTRLKVAFDETSKLLGLDAELMGFAPHYNARFNYEDAAGCKDLFQQEMVKRGVLMGTHINATWAHKSEHIEKTIKAIKKSLAIVAKSVDDIDRHLEGHRSMPIFVRKEAHE